MQIKHYLYKTGYIFQKYTETDCMVYILKSEENKNTEWQIKGHFWVLAVVVIVQLLHMY